MLHPPDFEHSAASSETSQQIVRAFQEGHADEYSARSLVRAGMFIYHPLRGGIFWRREPVKYIIVHSTETGIPLNAVRVIESWSSSGRRHAGAQFVVDRDGTIYLAVDPDLATVHINVFKTLPGINNDNSIGIEMCHTGRQTYTPEQRESMVKLVSYLQERYKVADDNVITHRYAQQGDHTDPVNFDWEQFLADKDHFHSRSIALKMNKMREDARTWEATAIPPPTTYLQPHPLVSTPRNGSPRTVSGTPVTGQGPDLHGPIEMDPALIKKIGEMPMNAENEQMPAARNSEQSIIIPAPIKPSLPVLPARPPEIRDFNPHPPLPVPAPARNAAPTPAPRVVAPETPDSDAADEVQFFIR